jgi:DNA topoisomerase I
MPRLRRSDCSGPGIRRRGRGRGFEYLDEEGGRIEDPEIVDRIAQLSIPPAWREVWICADPLGHLQATGIDDAGRKQYLYHPAWRDRRDQTKFDQMLEFARALPRIRRGVDRDLAGDEPTRDRVLAAAVRLLDRGFFRIGGETYAEENESYGLATMRKRHVTLDRDTGEIVFDYEAKGGQRRVQSIIDPELAPLVATLKRRRGGGEELLAYRNGRRWADVRSEDVNEYLKSVAGAEFSAKDFRTWSATVLAAVALGAMPVPDSKTARKRRINDAVKGVAAFLGNTPAVCRASYIDPRVFDRYRGGVSIAPALRRAGSLDEAYMPSSQRRIERAVIRLVAT